MPDNLQNEIIVFVHGFMGSRLDLWPMSWRLRQAGYEVNNWSYRSLGNRIQTHAERLGQALAAIDDDAKYPRFHLVTHSMGGIIARTMFESRSFQNLGRVVMLAPPHRGSHMARRFAPFFNWIAPSLGQLSDASDSFVNQLPNPLLRQQIEFGIIEATKDRVIAPGHVHLDGYRDLAQVKGHHGILGWYPQTISLVQRFLEHGSFECAASQSELPDSVNVSKSVA